MTPLVLVGFADALAAIESVWCLVDHGFQVHAFARSGTRPALSRCRGVRVITIMPPEYNARLASADLARAIRELRPAALMPLDDQAVWLVNQAVAGALADDGWGQARNGVPADDGWGQARNGVPADDGARQVAPGVAADDACRQIVGRTVVAGPLGLAAELALDKRLQLKAAQSAGFAAPPSCDPTGGPLPGCGPWMVKPALAVELAGDRLRRGSGKIARTPAEARAAAAAVGGPAIVQPLIEGTGEGLFGLATPTGVVALSAHRRIRMMNPRGSGSSACRSIPVDSALVGPVREFVAATSWRGPFMIELLRDQSGTPWFMELNGRAWGSMALACRRGLAYPAWAVRAALDPAWLLAEPPPAAHLTARHLGREIVHVGAVLAKGGAPRLRTMRDVLTVRRSDRWYNWRRGNASVFVADTWATVSGQLRRPGTNAMPARAGGRRGGQTGHRRDASDSGRPRRAAHD
ncbi:MAG TPA: hypothetical protein VIV12_30200 [Streptosporangiaceae bacterium]